MEVKNQAVKIVQQPTKSHDTQPCLDITPSEAVRLSCHSSSCRVPAANIDSVFEIIQPEASKAGGSPPVSCDATGVLKARPPSSTPTPPLPPLRPLPDDFIVWKVVASDCSESEARARWTKGRPVELAQVCRITVRWEAAKGVLFFFPLWNFLKKQMWWLWVVPVLPQRQRLHLNTSVGTIRVWQNNTRWKNSRSFDRISKSDMSELMCPKHASMLKMWEPHGLWVQPTQLWDYSAHKTTKRPHHIGITQKEAVAISRCACRESKQQKKGVASNLSTQLELRYMFSVHLLDEMLLIHCPDI